MKVVKSLEFAIANGLDFTTANGEHFGDVIQVSRDLMVEVEWLDTTVNEPSTEWLEGFETAGRLRGLVMFYIPNIKKITVLATAKDGLLKRGQKPARKGVFSRMVRNKRASGSVLHPEKPF